MAETAVWPWLTLIGLGMFHGANPAMGWLFAVALGLHRDSRREVLAALTPDRRRPSVYPRRSLPG